MKSIALTMMLLALAAVPAAVFAQSDKSEHPQTPAEAPRFYRMDFVLEEVDTGKVVNSRSYFMIVSTLPQGDRASSIRSGDKVPFETGKNGDYQQLDVGVNIDCRRPTVLGDELAMRVDLEISSMPPGNSAGPGPPLLRNTRWGSDVLLPLRKPTIVFSSDDAASKGKLQLEITATPIH